MTYYIYHIPGKKIGVTRDLEERVTKQQGYESDEYEILGEYINIALCSSIIIFYCCISVSCVQNESMFRFHIDYLTFVLRVLVILKTDIDHYRNQTTNR